MPIKNMNILKLEQVAPAFLLLFHGQTAYRGLSVGRAAALIKIP